MLTKGHYTGSKFRSVDSDGCITSITHYLVGRDEGGWHCHENPHIDFVFQGGDIEKRKKATYKRKTGDIDYYEAGEFHETICRNEDSKSLILELSPQFLKRYGLNDLSLTSSIKNSIDAKLLSIKMVDELMNYDACSPASLQSISLCLLDHSKEHNYTLLPSWVPLVSELLNDKWNELVTLEELSVTAGVHPITVSKYFRKYFSCTLGEYRRKLKIIRGIELIKSSQAPLTTIAFQCGFSDQSHFIRNFKRFTGMLPKEFRKT